MLFTKIMNLTNETTSTMFTRLWMSVLCVMTIIHQNEGKVYSFTTPRGDSNEQYFFNDLGYRVTERHTITFDVKMCNGALINLLETSRKNGTKYYVFLGYEGRTGIWDNEMEEYVDVITLNPLDCSLFKTFWIDWHDGDVIDVGRGAVVGSDRILSHSPTEKITFNLISAFSSTELSGEWRVDIDEAPVFYSPHYDNNTVVDVAEGTPSGTHVYTLEAFDMEGDDVTYKLVGGHTDEFHLQISTQNCSLSYYLANSTSYTIQASMGVRIVPTYGEKPVLTAVAVMLRENLPVGTAIHGTYVLKDRDIGDSFNFTLSGSDAKYFRVGVVTGDVFVARTLDYDADDSHTEFQNLVLCVVDRGGNQDNVTLSIQLNETNDEAPVIHRIFQTATITGGVQEVNAIAQFNCTDTLEHDTTSAYDVYIDNQLNGTFRFEDNTLFVDTTNITYDGVYDTDGAYTITVMCVDAPTTGQPLTSSAIVLVEVRPDNSNDYTPVLDNMDTVTVAENTAPGTVITTLLAVDEDAGVSGDVVYSIESVTTEDGQNALSTFHLDCLTGELKTSLTLDVDEEADKTVEYVVTVVAADNGSPSRSSTATMTIRVQDSDDLPASFQESTYFLNVTCSQAIGSIVKEFSLQEAHINSNTNRSIAVSGDGSEFVSVRGLSLVLNSRPIRSQYSEFALTVVLNKNDNSEAEDVAILVLSFVLICDETTTMNDTVTQSDDLNNSTGSSTSSGVEWAVLGVAVTLCTALMACVLLVIAKQSGLCFKQADVKVNPDKPSLCSNEERGRPSTPLVKVWI